MNEALLRSGYVIESRVGATLRHCGWFPETNVPYEGSDGAKSRELDLRAIKFTEGSDAQYLGVELLIECVNNPEPVAVIAHPDRPAAPLLLAGCPQLIVESLPRGEGASPGRMFPIAQVLGVEFHRYEDGETLRATQFCSFVKKKQPHNEWMATHTEEHYMSVSGLLEAGQHFMDDFYDEAYAERRPRDEYLPNLHVFYPMLVLGGALFGAWSLEDGGLEIEEVTHAVLMTSAYQRGRRVVCPIDVVTEKGLPALLETIEIEVGKILARMAAKGDLIAWSRRHIAAHVPADMETGRGLRKYLEPR